MLKGRIDDMLRDGLHLEGVEVLKVERMMLRNPEGKASPYPYTGCPQRPMCQYTACCEPAQGPPCI